MRKLALQALCLALIFTACGCCCHGSHRMWPFCGTRRCPPAYMPQSNPCQPGVCPPAGGGGGYYPSGSYDSYSPVSPVSGPVATPTFVPATAMYPIESLPTF